jgi:hypothetical protein
MVEEEVEEGASLSTAAPLREPNVAASPATLEIWSYSLVMVEWWVMHCRGK